MGGEGKIMSNISAYIEAVAKHYWGDPREKKGHELRWGARGSKSVDLRKGTWFDFEANEGGGVIDMVRVYEGATLRSLPDILEKQFGIAKQKQNAIQPAKYISKIYEYVDQHGEVTYQVVRYEPKTFRQRRPDGNGGWLWNMQDVVPVPYNLPDIMANPHKTVFVVEGEKCADMLKAHGAIATTSHGGAKKWAEELNQWFEGRKVVVLPDADEAGKAHADMVVANLLPSAAEIKCVDLPDLSDKQDVFDWFKNGGNKETLAKLVANAEPITVAPEVELEQDNEPQEDVFEIYDINYLRTMPPVEFLVDGVLTKHGLAVLYGEPGAGKSFLAIDIALSVAYGVPWHNRPVEQGAVLYIAGEGVGGLGKRIKAWQMHYHQTEDVPFYVLPTAVRFRDMDDVEKLLRTIDSLGKTFKAVFVDTVARALLGGDENSATDMGMFVDACEAVKRHCNCALIAVHHSGKDAARGMRGSTALLGAVDTSVRISKNEDSVTMMVEKQKDAEPTPDQTFEMVPVALLDDVSVVMKAIDAPEPKKKRGVKLTAEQQIALQSLRNTCVQMNMDRIPVSTWHDAHKMKTPDVTSGKRRDARAALQNKGVIVVEDNKVWEYKEIDGNV